MPTATKIKPEVLDVLGRSTVTENQLRLPEQLDRKLYVEVNKVLEALGGTWNRKARAHLFLDDAADVVDAAVLTGEFARPQDFGFFETPDPLAAQLVKQAGIERQHHVLEPSAGRGAIARAILLCGARPAMGPVSLDCIELQDQHVDFLHKDLLPRFRDTEVRIMQRDFLTVTPPAPEFQYDRIVMNPPFSKQADLAHVTHALSFLKPGGRLVSVMAAGVLFRTDRKTTTFRDLLRGVGGPFCGVIEPLPEGSFKVSGTNVNTVVVDVYREP